MPEFDWDEANIRHIAEHDLLPEDVEFALSNWTFDVTLEDWHGEVRYQEVGTSPSGRILAIWTTWRGSKLRVVTAYDAPKRLAAEYLKHR